MHHSADTSKSRVLIDHGADVHAVSGKGQTPYQLSLAYGYREIGNLLLEHGAGTERSDYILLWLKCDV
jgi:ankyrin repeat protein